MSHLLRPNSLLLKLAVCLAGISLAACSTTAANTAAGTANASRALSYNGLFTSSCSELDQGLYFADAIELKPKGGSTVNAQYIKVFFTDSKCALESRLVQLRLPMATWEILQPVKTKDKTADQVKITLVAGPIAGVIFDASKVKETDAVFDIHYGTKDSNLPIQKLTDAKVEKELRLVDGDTLYMSDSNLPTSPDGFPTGLDVSDVFSRQ